MRRFVAFERAGGIAALDGLRALAILLVLGRHGVRPFWHEGEALLPLGPFDLGVPLINGWAGVDLFFVLSGFLITHHFLDRYGGRLGGLGLRDYLARRALRIVPAYLAVLAVAALGLFPLYPVADDLLGFRVAYHLLFLQDYLPANIVVTFWSLGVEEKFYLAAPFALAGLLAVRDRRVRYLLLGLALLLPAGLRWATDLGRPGIDSYDLFFAVFRSPFHLCLDALAAGVGAALLWHQRPAALANPRLVGALFWAGAALAGGLIGLVPLLDRIDAFDKIGLGTLLALAFGAMVAGAAFGGGPQRLLGRPGLFVIARLSYALYLVHLPLIPAALWLAGAIPGYGGWDEGLRFALFLPGYLGLSFAAALALHLAVERPFLALKDRRRGPACQPKLQPSLACHP